MARLTDSAGAIPDALPGQRVAVSLPRLPPTPRFVFAYHPERWIVRDGQVVPALAKLAIIPGVGGVDARGNPFHMLAKRQRDGWTVIPEDVDGPGTSYVRKHRSANAQGVEHDTYLDRWERAFKGSERIGEGGIEYTEWLQSLIDRGIVNPPAIHVLERMLEDYRHVLDAARDKSAKNPGKNFHADALAEQVSAIEARLAEALASAEQAEPEALAPLEIEAPKPRSRK